MRRRTGIGITAMLAMLASTLPVNAEAAVEVGNDCVASQIGPDYTLLQLARAPGAPLPNTVPVAGVVTSWKVRATGFPGTVPERLRVFRPAEGINEFRAVAESELGAVENGQNVFATRIPVQAGDRFGVYGGPTSGAANCPEMSEGDVIGAFAGNVTVGSSQVFSAIEEVMVAVSAVVEPDVDGDGFGDETQDGCPQLGTVQTSCPLTNAGLLSLSVDSFAVVRPASIVVLVSTSAQSQVTVTGTARSGAAGTRSAFASARIVLPRLTRTVAPGQLGRFALKLPASLKAQLAQLPRQQSVRVTVTVKAKDDGGGIKSETLKLRLRGRA